MRSLSFVLSFISHATGSDGANQIVGVREIETQRRLEDAGLVPTIFVSRIEAIAGEFRPLDHRDVRVVQDRHDCRSNTNVVLS